MVSSDVVEYIKEQLHAGYSEGEIIDALRKEGWTDKEIDEGFALTHHLHEDHHEKEHHEDHHEKHKFEKDHHKHHKGPELPDLERKKGSGLGFILSLIGGILLLISSLEMLASISINSFFESFGLTIGFFGYFAGMMSVIETGMALVVFAVVIIIGSVIIRKAGKARLGGILVLIFSVLSLVGFTGFILFIGALLGIIGGIVGIIKN
jgi:hypothetical protein